MGYLSDPQKMISKRFTSDSTVTQRDLGLFNRAVLGSAGVRLKIPQGDEGNYHLGKNLVVTNESSGVCSLWRDDAFGTDNDTMLIGSRDEFEIEMIDLQSSGTYRWHKRNHKRPSEVASCTPTLAWVTNTATVTSNTMYYSVVTCGQAQGLFFHGRIVVSDGKDAAGVTIAFPSTIIPEMLTNHASLAFEVAVDVRVKVDTTWNDGIGFVDISNSTAETRAKIQHHASITYTDTKACEVLYSGFIPLSGWTAFTPQLAYETGTATFSEAGYYMMLGENTYAFFAQTATTDSDGEQAVTLTPPIPTQDINCLTSCKAIELAGAGGATYSNPDPTFNMLDNAGANRTLTNKALTTATDGQNFVWSVAGIVPIRNWQAATLSVTYGTATPETNLGETMYFDGYDNMTFIAGHITFDDGNACDSVVATGLPVPPRAACVKIAIPCMQVQHSDVFTMPGLFLDSDDTDPDDRAIEFDDLTTFDDTEVGELQWAGFYFV